MRNTVFLHSKRSADSLSRMDKKTIPWFVTFKMNTIDHAVLFMPFPVFDSEIFVAVK